MTTQIFDAIHLPFKYGILLTQKVIKLKKVDILKTEKKENMLAKQKYIAIMKRNRQINKVNIFILAAGLLLTLVNYEEIGNQVIWLGIIIFIYTMGSNLIARTQIRKFE